MDGEFRIEVDAPRDLVRIAMSGFFTRETVEAFLEERRRAHARLLCGPNQHLTLNDMRGMDVRSQEIVDSFRSVLADPAYRSRKLAFVVTSALSRMQLQRTLNGRNAECFESVAEAEAWLFAGD